MFLLLNKLLERGCLISAFEEIFVCFVQCFLMDMVEDGL